MHGTVGTVTAVMETDVVICCRFSIHVTDSQPGETRAAVEGMPMLVPGGLQSVYHCGFSSEGKAL